MTTPAPSLRRLVPRAQGLPNFYDAQLSALLVDGGYLSDNSFEGLGNVYAGLVVELVGAQYRKLALRLTQWENHRLASDFKQAANLKLFVFMVFNCYFSVVWLAFFDANEKGLPCPPQGRSGPCRWLLGPAACLPACQVALPLAGTRSPPPKC